MAQRSRPGGDLVPALLLGAATGLRSQTGWACLLARSDGARLPARFRNPWIRRAALVAAAGELVVDKLPSTPARTAPLPLAARMVFGALTAGTGAATIDGAAPPAAAVGALAALGAAFAGRAARQAVTDRTRRGATGPAPTRRAFVIAVVEDAVAIALATGGAQLLVKET